jgi:regulatory protein
MINEVALAKLQKYCAYQERCHKEVRTKLISLKVYGDELEEIISELISDNFLNEERYATSYARGKFRIKSWGKNKIKQKLKFMHVSNYCIKKAMEEIDEDEYLEMLNSILVKQIEKNSKYNDMVARHKAIQYAISRGYETSIVYDQIKSVMP